MKLVNKLMLSLALALGATGSAFADTYLPLDAGAPGDFTNTWTFDGAMESATSTHVKGAQFDDFYTFNVLETENVTFDLNPTKSAGAVFTSYILYAYSDGTEYAYQDGFKFTSLSTLPVLLTSGVYTLGIEGNYLKAGGTYSGTITGEVLAVPEPSSWMMMFAGLTLLAATATARARKNRV